MKRLLVLLIAPLVGAVLGYLLAQAINNGRFQSKWQKIENPPVQVHRLVAVSKGGLWVANDSDILYYNENPSSCQAQCWQEVAELPSLPIVEPYERSVTSIPCAPAPPLSRITATVSECRRETWIDRISTFALRADGSLYLWQVDLATEWSAMLMILTVCMGAVALFLLALLVALLDWLVNRSREKQRGKKSTAA